MNEKVQSISIIMRVTSGRPTRSRPWNHRTIYVVSMFKVLLL